MDRNQKVLLIYPPNQLLPTETLRPDGSLGLLYLAGALERAGFETDIVDASVGTEKDCLQNTFYKTVLQDNGLVRIGMSEERIRELIADRGYSVVGINSNFTQQTRMALDVARIAKSVDSRILVVVGGTNARNLSERFLNSGYIDAVCLTEGEKIFPRVIHQWFLGNGFGSISGISYRKKKQIIINPALGSDIHDDLDCLSFPAWEKLPFNKYDHIVSSRKLSSEEGVRYAPIMTSRGCPFRCAYCHISTEKEADTFSGGIGSLRLKSISRVLEEMEYLQSLGVKQLYFEDDSLLAKKNRIKTIFERAIKMNFKIANVNGVNLVHFYQRSKKTGVLELDVEYLKLLKSVGFHEVSFPVESASQRILNKYATGKLNLESIDLVHLVTTISRIGIACPINMMIGFPDETEEEMLKSIEFGKRLVDAGAEYCTFFIPIPFPGSKLFDIAIAGGHLGKDFDTDMMNWKNVIMKNTAVPPERIMELREWAWRKANTAEHIRKRIEKNIV